MEDDAVGAEDLADLVAQGLRRRDRLLRPRRRDVAVEAVQRQRDQDRQRVVAAPPGRLAPGPGAAGLDARLLEQLGPRRARAVAQRSQVDLEHELKADLVRRYAIAQALGYVGWLRVKPGVAQVTAIVIGLEGQIQVPWVRSMLGDEIVVFHWDDVAALPKQLRDLLGDA